MTNKKAFKKALGSVLLNADFVSDANGWRATGKDVVVVVEINKSPYDEQHYINVGFWLNRLGLFMGQKYNKCHMYFRLEGLFPSRRSLILDSLVLCKTDGSEVNQEFFDFMKSEAISFIKACTQLPYLARALREGLLADGLVLREAKELLSKE